MTQEGEYLVKLMKSLSCLFVSLTLLWSLPGFSCSSFMVEKNNELAIGKSYDWYMGHGLLVVNKRNVAKMTLGIKPGDKPTTWVSKYGSVTFNQYGVEFPNGGMNEKGLTIEILWLDSSKYPDVDKRATINEVQWIQYQLDNYESVSEVITNAKKLRLSSVYANVHYLVCEKSSRCAVFEWIKGKLVISDNVRGITNDTYADSAKFRKNFVGFGGNNPIPTSMGSKNRFVRISHYSQNANKTTDSVEKIAWDSLQSVKTFNFLTGYASYWNIVYSPTKDKLGFLHFWGKKVYELDLNTLDYSCLTPRQTFDLELNYFDSSISENFKEYDRKMNERMLQRSLGPIQSKLPPGAMQKLVEVPEAFKCME
ncbi:MAG: linear amide C-N hydrolase [Bacteriovoracaceae bacterium]